ncbi:MAG: hypothetical protein A3J29_19390 [Acidobacteria bacterium RIFCSPLOWO2_12_FULL_67_14b]|nr:MAG: hypothetical protein A3J29_19390 [Acidobacteria bacterium RIFCSPLOWO2_12_FULL_67_14b]
MTRLSSAAVVLGVVLSSAGVARAQSFTCDPEFLDRESYRLATDAQAMNVTRPRTNWWDGFDASLRTHQDALGDLNEAALTIAERALELDARNQLARSQLARQLVILGAEGARARAEIKTLFGGGGALAWTATLYDVDAKAFFVMGFDRAGIKVFRFGEAAPDFTKHLGVPEFPGPEAKGLWRAWGGCFGGLREEAAVPWSDVREIAAGNFVLYFKFTKPVTVTSDNRKKKTLKEFKVALHGAMGTVEFRQTPDSGEDDRWFEDTRTFSGVGIGPSTYQDRIRRVLVAEVDPTGRIALPKQKRGAGW